MASNHADIELYRARAAQCLSLAHDSPLAETQAELLEMARGWLILADQAEKNGEITVVYETPEPRAAATPAATKNN